MQKRGIGRGLIVAGGIAVPIGLFLVGLLVG